MTSRWLDDLLDRLADLLVPRPATRPVPVRAPAHPTGNPYGYDERSHGTPPKGDDHGKPYSMPYEKKSFLGEILAF